MKLRCVAVTAMVALVIPLGGTMAACSGSDDDYATVSVEEDCDLKDQSKREDDCGYWQKGDRYRVGSQPDLTWLWVWYTWVHVGSLSTPPPNWRAPHNLTYPKRQVRIPRKSCALGAFTMQLAPAPPRPAPARPAPARPPAGNNQQRPAQRPAQQPVPKKPPIYVPPAGRTVHC